MASIGLRLTPEEEEGWADLVRPMAEARVHSVHDMAESLARTVHERLALDQQLFDATLASAESGLEDILRRMIEQGDPARYQIGPPAVAYAQDLARFGLPLEVIFQVGHVGQSHILKDCLERFHELQGDPRAVGAISYCENFTFLWMDALYRQWRECFLTEREPWQQSVAAVQLETARSVLAGETTGPALASRRLRYDLGGAQRAFLLWTERPEADDRELLRRGRLVAEAVGGGQVLLIPWTGGVVAGWVDTADAVPLERVRAIVRGAEVSDLRIAFGAGHYDIEGFRRSHEEATETRRVARLPGRSGLVHEYRTVALTALATTDLRQARHFVLEELGPLAQRDDATVRVASTLKAYFEELGNAGRVARRLGIHKNTVLYRLQRAEQLLGRSLHERHLELQIALTLARTLGEEDGLPGPGQGPVSSA